MTQDKELCLYFGSPKTSYIHFCQTSVKVICSAKLLIIVQSMNNMVYKLNYSIFDQSQLYVIQAHMFPRPIIRNRDKTSLNSLRDPTVTS